MCATAAMRSVATIYVATCYYRICIVLCSFVCNQVLFKCRFSDRCCLWSIDVVNKSVFSLVPRLSTWRCPQLQAPELIDSRYATPAVADRYLLLPPRLRQAAVVDRRDRQTDRRTDIRPLHRPCAAFYAGNVNQFNVIIRTTWQTWAILMPPILPVSFAIQWQRYDTINYAVSQKTRQHSLVHNCTKY